MATATKTKRDTAAAPDTAAAQNGAGDADAAFGEDPPATEPEQISLLPEPMFDGKKIEKLSLAITGRLELSPYDERDVALYRLLKLGENIVLRIEDTQIALEGAVISKNTKLKRDQVGYNVDTTQQARVHIESLTYRDDQLV